MPGGGGRSRRVAQAGAIAVKGSATAPRFLLVNARKDPTRWIFPKGNIERGERMEETAVRELREEAGVVGRVVCEVGSVSFRSGDERVEVTYFLVRALRRRKSEEDRDVRWLSLRGAMARLSY